METNGLVVGYARTSTEDQKAGLDDQLATLKKAGCKRLYFEHASAFGSRPQLDACLAWLREGDTFVVTTPSRLARNAVQGLKLVQELATRKVGVRILDMGLDTSSPTGEAMLGLLFVMAKWERDVMLERQRAGIARAKAEGKYRGRKPTVRLRKAEILSLAKWLRKDDGTPNCAAIATQMGCHRSSVSRVLGSAD